MRLLLVFILLAGLLSSCRSANKVKFPRTIAPRLPQLADLPPGDQDILLSRLQNAKDGEADYQAALVAYFEGQEDVCLARLRSARRHFTAVSTPHFSERARIVGNLIGQICQHRAMQLARLGDHLGSLGDLDGAEARYKQAVQLDGQLKSVLAPRVARLHKLRGERYLIPE